MKFALKKIYFLLAVGALFFLILFFVAKKYTPLGTHQLIEGSHHVTEGANSLIAQALRLATPVVNNIKKEVQVISEGNGVAEDERILDQWIEDKGYTKLGRNDPEYASYNIETLQRLADNGDVRAMMALGKKMHTIPGQGVSAAKKFYQQAAIYGSTRAINDIGKLTYLYDVGIASKQLEPDKARAAWVSTLSWYELAKLRGDRHGWTEISFFFSKSNVTLTPDDWSQIRTDGKKLYETLQDQRLALGLGEYNNTEPKSVKSLYDISLRAVKPDPEFLK